jgi:Uma2 family endonuclease
MEARSTRQRWTYAEFARLPSEGSTRYEVVDGEVCVTPSPTSRHQRIVGKLVTLLTAFAESHRLGATFPAPLDVLLGDGDYVQPDILFILKGRPNLLTDRGVEGPPDLVVEILSPSTAARDRGIKLERYRLYGVAEYWIVDPDADTVEVWRLAEGAHDAILLDRESVLRWTPVPDGPALDIALTDLFAAA